MKTKKALKKRLFRKVKESTIVWSIKYLLLHFSVTHFKIHTGSYLVGHMQVNSFFKKHHSAVSVPVK